MTISILARKTRSVNPSIFFRSAGKLKTIKRSGWLRKVGITRDCESVADHSFRTALLSLYFGTELGLDACKLVRMALIHDLAESKIGDLMPEEKISELSHRADENRIIQEITAPLPEKTRNLVLSDWGELVNAKTPEARLAWQLDKLEMYLQSKDYEKRGYDKGELAQFQNLEKFDAALAELARLYPLTI